MRMTSKGQVTIPKHIRERLGIAPGDDVEFVEKDNHVELATKQPRETPESRKRRLRAALQDLSGTLDLAGQTTDEYIETIRGGHEELNAG